MQQEPNNFNILYSINLNIFIYKEFNIFSKIFKKSLMILFYIYVNINLIFIL